MGRKHKAQREGNQRAEAARIAQPLPTVTILQIENWCNLWRGWNSRYSRGLREVQRLLGEVGPDCDLDNTDWQQAIEQQFAGIEDIVREVQEHWQPSHSVLIQIHASMVKLSTHAAAVVTAYRQFLQRRDMESFKQARKAIREASNQSSALTRQIDNAPYTAH